jgi:hypothetical protein
MLTLKIGRFRSVASALERYLSPLNRFLMEQPIKCSLLYQHDEVVIFVISGAMFSWNRTSKWRAYTIIPICLRKLGLLQTLKFWRFTTAKTVQDRISLLEFTLNPYTRITRICAPARGFGRTRSKPYYPPAGLPTCRTAASNSTSQSSTPPRSQAQG